MKAVMGDVSIIAGFHLSWLRDMPIPVARYIIKRGAGELYAISLGRMKYDF